MFGPKASSEREKSKHYLSRVMNKQAVREETDHPLLYKMSTYGEV